MSMSTTRRLAAATMLAGVGTVAMAGAANATESQSHGTEHASSHHKGLVSGVVGAAGELGQGVGGLVGGVGGAVHGILDSDTVGSIARGLL
ncbi:hypothetical protein LQ327_32360 [Actinomycetospora endophytica]|uniref:Secreted protein n=1 Tax=Actinomycetospora endophytica TaxID=2291215 RepID=A0ABS8PIJ3_9PSEU|nr:hypothetical protein [Actinomycetospora endophytica]MCD2198074.1 hypothetical protein [Actinomycetospora endophytica]